MRAVALVFFVLALAACGSGSVPPVPPGTADWSPAGIYIAQIQDFQGKGAVTLAFSYDGNADKSVGVLRIHASGNPATSDHLHGKYKAPYTITGSSYDSRTGLTLTGKVDFGGVLGSASFVAVLNGNVVRISLKDALGSSTDALASYAGPYITRNGSPLQGARRTQVSNNSLLGYWVLTMSSPTSCNVGNYQFPLSCFPWPYDAGDVAMNVTSETPDGYGGIDFTGTLYGTVPEFTAIGEPSAVRPLTGDPDDYAGDWHASVEIDAVSPPFYCYPATNVLEVGTAQWNPPLPASGDPGFWEIYQLYPPAATDRCGSQKNIESGGSTLYTYPSA